MTYSVRDVQARCAALGFDPGPIDGMMGPQTRRATAAAFEARGVRKVADLFGPSGLHRVHWHWTAGADGLIDMERRAYNELVDRDGNVWDGVFRPEAQATYRIGRAASHTLNANTGAIGLAADAMAGAQERPFFAGAAPLTWPQVHALCERTAQHCEMYDIPVSKWSTLTHAEVQPTLGIRQRFKWDITWLPDMSAPGDPVQIGERLRGMVREHLQDVRAAA